MGMIIRPMIPEERKYTYAQSRQIMGQTGSIGRLRGDFGSSGQEFFTSWDDHQTSLKTDEFKSEFDDVIGTLRRDMLRSRGEMNRYQKLFEAAMEYFSHYEEGNPDIAAINPQSIPEFFDIELSMEEAQQNEEFGKYMLLAVPNGFTEESIRRYKDQNSDYLSGLWTKGYDELSWRVSFFSDEDAGRITGVIDKENYDLSLYPIPRAESVPDELREIVDNPIFIAEELTLDAVYARAYKTGETGDSNGWRMNFSVKFDNVIVTVRAKGTDPEWIYNQLKSMI